MTQSTTKLVFAVGSILLSLLLTSLLIMAVGKDPVAVLQSLWEGAFRNPASLADVLELWIPLTLASVGLVVTFTAGLWNIGVEGQMTMGAIFASAVALSWHLPGVLQIGAELMAAALGGALWGALVGFLRIRLGVNEIFGGVALNALASTTTLFLITGPWQPPEGGKNQASPPFPTEALLPPMSEDFKVNLFMLILVVVIVAVMVYALRFSRWGLQLKATGKNPKSALLLGVPTNITAMSAFLVCGALAGLGGAHRVLFTFEKLRPLASGGIGFLALLVVLLLSSRIIWVPLISFIFAAILSGSQRLRISQNLDSSVVGVMQEILVVTVLLATGLRNRLMGKQADGGSK